ncbi:diaminobutyrate--2-oxoglutarate aminotransferase [Rhodopirellula maiorica SM1]|uniref:Diaminobutyrate--2-oxoglutarate transaminase n=1 Tax=Rhodopirellula maiorica SM1 TaxID=1265738 RepID=M5RD71_9BACT|nr:diaminobutyrate--2-oxoglutarate transaminase [Rhodopirellula maiorica]EMI17021.1 diaminobutyrate--2-oxoglutarate aminotransferase [Rhodopirellula maiorica SM1]
MQDPLVQIESNVRGYARLFPAVFNKAVGSIITDTEGNDFVDFLCGAGSLNYGHNNQHANAALLRYIQANGIQHSLDTVTTAKVEFLEAFERIILKPRALDYRVQFTGPTGTNAVEAAIKLARKQTQRSHIVAFTNAYHGHSLGALALTGNQFFHSQFYGSHNNVTHLPFDGYMDDYDTSLLLEKMLNDSSSGLPKPAAVILETIQGEGGVNVASDTWLRRIASLCKEHEIHLIVDDIQVGNGRSGKFFSFEHAGITPDIVCVSKSIGSGMPMSIVLIRPEIDAWKPGEHTGTFRGNNLAFVSARAVLEYWNDPSFEQQIEDRSQIVQQKLQAICLNHIDQSLSFRGRGMIWGLDMRCGDLASQTIQNAFKEGLLIEGAGASDQVLKVLPALTIETSVLQEGLRILESAVDAAIASRHYISSKTPTTAK